MRHYTTTMRYLLLSALLCSGCYSNQPQLSFKELKTEDKDITIFRLRTDGEKSVFYLYLKQTSQRFIGVEGIGWVEVNSRQTAL